jgi:hypothetical protein
VIAGARCRAGSRRDRPIGVGLGVDIAGLLR